MRDLQPEDGIDSALGAVELTAERCRHHSEGTPDKILDPRATWADQVAYDDRAGRLAIIFAENFTTFEGRVSAEVRAAGPVAARV